MNKQAKKSFTLINKQDISNVFKEGKSINGYPFRLSWICRKDIDSIKVLFSVPKKKFKRAVDRNLIKRQIKELFFNEIMNEHIKKISIDLVISYIGNEKMEFSELRPLIIKTFNKLIKDINNEAKTS